VRVLVPYGPRRPAGRRTVRVASGSDADGHRMPAECPGDPGEGMTGLPLAEDPLHDRGGVRWAFDSALPFVSERTPTRRLRTVRCKCHVIKRRPGHLAGTPECRVQAVYLRRP
jgi:hypothetical protein